MLQLFSAMSTIQTALGLEGIESHVGNTPLVALRRVTQGLSPRVRVFAKAEVNPSGSVKDRPAIHIIRSAQDPGCWPASVA
jgi:cysteine synthase